MATVRFSISMPPEIRDRIKEHATEAGLDVSTFLTIAAQAQMDQQDRVKKLFAHFEQARAEAEAHADTTDTWTDGLELTPEEQADVDAILGRVQRGQEAA
ncbi:hypothetical protein [Streptomyces sp. NPDC000410]|uniref:hypothetical protein n=1 Tax=Streptomyces sp. NPDC000410 TaxID=3154254 RepID=UPI003321138D